MFCAPFERCDEPDVQLLLEQLMTASGARPTGQLASSALSAVAAAEGCTLAVCNTCGQVPTTTRCPLDSAMCGGRAAGVRPSCRRLPAGVADGANEAGLLVDMDGSCACALGFSSSFSESTRRRRQSAAGTSSATARAREQFPFLHTLLLFYERSHKNNGGTPTRKAAPTTSTTSPTNLRVSSEKLN